jgi:hypothetical protein
VNSVKPSLADFSEFGHAHFGQRAAPGIGCDSLDPGNLSLQMTNRFGKHMGGEHKAVGVLDEYASFSHIEPNGCLPVKIIEASAGKYVFQDFAGNSPPVAQGGGKGTKFLTNLRSSINVSLDFFQRAPAELPALVHRTEGTPVPGTISREPEQQAPRFAGRTYWTLFELLVTHNSILSPDIGSFQHQALTAKLTIANTKDNLVKK